MRRVLIRLTLVLSGALSAPIAAQEASLTRLSIGARRAPAEIRIDGEVERSEWASADSIGNFQQIEPSQGAPTRFPTTVRVLFDDEHLYVSFFCRDSLGAAGVRVQDLRRKWDFFANDFFGVTIDALHDGRNSVSFQVTPYGSLRDLQAFDGVQFNREWEGVWRARTRIADSGWTGEMAIPWATLRYRPDGEGWGINFYRSARRANETSAWSPWPRAFNNNRMAFAGRITGLEPPPPRANLRLRPYAIAQGDRSGIAPSSIQRVQQRVGGELTWTPTPNSTLDVTVNTDFAQADVDRQVVNLSRFSVFFPERRQFFLDAANVFAIGFTNDYNYGAQFNIQPFFSRRIGLDASGNPVALDGGARYVRRDASSSLGLLATRQRGTDAQSAESFAVGRYSRNVGRTSRVGGLFTSRVGDARAGRSARSTTVAALDGFTRIAELISANGLVALSSNDSGPRGVAASMLLQRETDRWLLILHQGFASEHYNPGTGFISRTNAIYTNPVIRGRLRPSWKPDAIRFFVPYLSVTAIHTATTGVLQEIQGEAFVDFLFQNGALVYPAVQHAFQRLDRPFQPVRGVEIPAGTYENQRFVLYAASDASARWSAIAEASTGGYFDRALDRGDLTVRVAPSPKVALSLKYQRNRIHGRGRAVATDLLAPELRLAVNPRLLFTTFYQHNTDTERGALNARFSWELSPLSYLYIVMNDIRAFGSTPASTRNASRAQQIILKFTALKQL